MGIERMRKLRTSIWYGESETGEPDRWILNSDKGLAGGKEEISGGCVRRGGKLDKGVSESVDVSEAGGAWNRFWKEDYLE